MCNNCGKLGHHFYQCKIPIVSYGIILFQNDPENGIQYLMIRRRNTFGFIDFMRGKYVLNNATHLNSMFDEMSAQEKRLIATHSFHDLWKHMWGTATQDTHPSNEEISAERKFEQLKIGYFHNEDHISIESLLSRSSVGWDGPEWEFPKGRKNYQEKELECALREFEEETGISKKHIHIVDNLMPMEEMFIGSNHKAYKHKYYLGFIDKENAMPSQPFQETEVSKMEWKSFSQCLESIRPYHKEKKRLIVNINKILEEYRLYYGQ
jgi:8-oxo-dGTP pyrophosphatase MutT (NUDIX family)